MTNELIPKLYNEIYDMAFKLAEEERGNLPANCPKDMEIRFKKERIDYHIAMMISMIER